MADEGLSRSRFEALFVKLEKPVFNVVYRWLWNTEESRDVTQEAFLKVWNARARVKLETVEPLVFQSALNLAANRLRLRRLRRFFSLETAANERDPRQTAESALESEQRRAKVREAIDALPEKLKAVVVLCEFSGLSTNEISQALGIPPGTVGSRRHQAMQQLETKLGSLEDAS
ncbi:MAG: sigma-70 family RNA polymerase sigma factor [Myxococcaceae bacterium]